IGSELAPAAGIDAAEEDLAPESVAELGAGGGQSPVRWGMCRERACRGRGRVAPRRSVARIRCVARPSRGGESARRARIVRVAVRRPASGLRSTARKGQDGADRGHEKAWYTCHVEPPPARTPEMKHVLLPLSEKSKDDVLGENPARARHRASAPRPPPREHALLLEAHDVDRALRQLVAR